MQKKTLDKIQHPFMIKTLGSGFRGNLPQHNKRPLHSKPTVRESSRREKIFANKATEKALISKIWKQLMQFNIRKKNQWIVREFGIDMCTLLYLKHNQQGPTI